MSASLDEVMPDFDFRERHGRWIDASPPEVWEALTTLTLDHLLLTRPLMAVRHLGRRRPTAGRSLFTDGPVRILETTAPSYAVGGAVARPWQLRPERRVVESLSDVVDFAEPGWTKYLTDFSLEPVDGGVRLTTETRGCSTDAAARRRFALYWAVIRWPSGLIRRDMLAAVARLATSPAVSQPR